MLRRLPIETGRMTNSLNFPALALRGALQLSQPKKNGHVRDRRRSSSEWTYHGDLWGVHLNRRDR